MSCEDVFFTACIIPTTNVLTFISPPDLTEGCSEGLDVVRFLFKQHHHRFVLLFSLLYALSLELYFGDAPPLLFSSCPTNNRPHNNKSHYYWQPPTEPVSRDQINNDQAQTT